MLFTKLFNIVLPPSATITTNETTVHLVGEAIGLFTTALLTAWFNDQIKYIGDVIYATRLITTCYFVCMILYYSYLLFKKFQSRA